MLLVARGQIGPVDRRASQQAKTPPRAKGHPGPGHSGAELRAGVSPARAPRDLEPWGNRDRHLALSVGTLAS